MGRTTQRQLWAALGSTLVLAAFIVLASVSIQSQVLPSPWQVDPTHDAAIHNLNNLYPWLAGSALIAGIFGLLALTAGRRPQWSQFPGRPRGRAYLLWLGALALGIFITMWIPWWAFMHWSAPMTGPSITLLFFISVTAVQVMLWWWIRRQTGADQGAWGAALGIQFVALLTTFVFVFYAVVIIADTPASDNGFVLLMLPISHPIVLFVGSHLATKFLEQGNAENSDDAAQHRPAARFQRTVAAASIVVIAIAAICAAWPRSMPGQIEPPTAEHHPSPGSEAPSESPTPSPSAPPATPEPTVDPTQAAPACEASALDMTIGGWDAATGARAAGIVVTNDDDADACQLQGTADLRITQADEDLEVNVSEYEFSEDGQETYETITIGPGQSAQAIAYWRGERSAYHDDSAQQAEVMVNEAWLAAEFEFHEHMEPMESPFDVIHGSDLEIGSWTLR